ncbi:MAG TPA: DUF3025 domain-containing protein [Gallionella sp.]
MKPSPEWNSAALLKSPLFEPLHAVLVGLDVPHFPTLEDQNALLDARQPAIRTLSGLPVRFVPQEWGRLPFERQYEPRCYLHGEVPTRSGNWHDLLNALVWLAFPEAKAAINARHYEALMKPDEADSGPGSGSGAGSQRGAVRDVNTLLDESGVIVPYADDVSGAGLAGLLRDFRWKELFWQHRGQVGQPSDRQAMGFYIFGHGLYEKALQPYVGMTGQGLLLAVEPAFFDWPLAQRLAYLDGQLAGHLAGAENCRNTRDLSPVPLLGVPGWAAENESEAYYDNTGYFRPGRRAQRSRE